MNLLCGKVHFFKKKIWGHKSFLVRSLIPLFWTYGELYKRSAWQPILFDPLIYRHVRSPKFILTLSKVSFQIWQMWQRQTVCKFSFQKLPYLKQNLVFLNSQTCGTTEFFAHWRRYQSEMFWTNCAVLFLPFVDSVSWSGEMIETDVQIKANSVDWCRP